MSKGRHRKRHGRKAFLSVAFAALAVMGTGIGIAVASSPPAAIRIAADPVIPPGSSPVPAQAPSPPSVRTYIAKEGDTLWGISASQCHSGNDWGSLAKANHISYPYSVTPGQKLTVSC